MIPSGHQFGNRVLPIPYRPIRFVDKGAVGEVWKASGPGGLVVAVKIVDLYGREGIKEFEGLQRIKNIRQPNLVPIIGYWLIEGGQIVEPISSGLSGAAMGSQPASPSSFDAGDSQAVASGPVTLVIAMGWGEKSLFSRLQECGKGGIPWDELLGYMDDAAKGIDYLNAGPPEPGVPGPGTPIIHGDIKPQNMLIVGDGVQVCDFGLARAVEAARKTTTGMGTVAYAAPELLRGKPHRTSDQYCLAISYVELRTGRLPFEEDLTPSEVVLRHERGDLDFSRLAPGEREVIRQATCRDPDQRWSLCRHMVRALRRACEAEAAAVAGQPAQRELAKALEPSREPAEDTGPVGRTLVVDQPPGAELTQTPSLRQVAETVRLHPKPSEPTPPPRPRRGRWLAVLLLLLIAVGGGVMAYPPARDSVIALYKSVIAFFIPHTRERPLEKPPPTVPKPQPGDLAKDIEGLIDLKRFSDAAKKLKDSRQAPGITPDTWDSLAKKLRDKWQADVDRSKQAKEYGLAIRVFEEAAWLCISSDAEREKQRGELVTLWSSQITELGKQGKFKEAVAEVNAVPDESPAGKEKKEKLRQELRVEWQKQFVALLKDGSPKGDFKPARDRLENAPAGFVDPEALKSSYADLVSAEARFFVGKSEFETARSTLKTAPGGFDKKLLESLYAELVKAEVSYLVGQNKAEAFEKAAEAIEKVLETRDHGRLEIGAVAKKAMREEVRKPWIGQLERNSAVQPDAEVVLSACGKIQKYFPESPEAALFRARALVRQGKVHQDKKAIDVLNAPSAVPDFSPLHSVLKFLADYHSQRSSIIRIDPEKEPEALATWKNRANDSLKLVNTADVRFGMKLWEGKAIKEIKDELDNIRPIGPPPPTEWEQVAERVKAGELDKARELLKSAKNLAPKKREFWGSVIELRDPLADPKQVEEALKGAENLLKSGAGLNLAETQILCDALGQMHLKQNPDGKTLTGQIDRAITLVADTCKRPANANLAVPLGKLWKRRIAISVKHEVPGKDEFDRFESDRKLWQGARPAGKSDVDEELIDLWQGECLLTCKRPREAQQKLAPHFDDKNKKPSAEWAPYAHYVWASTLRHTPDWQEVLNQLDQAFPTGQELPVVLKVPERLKTTADLVARTSASLRSSGQPTALTPNPFGDPDNAKRHYRLLNLAYVNLPKGEHPQELKIGLALAAWYKLDGSQSDRKLAASLTKELVKLEEKQLGPETKEPVKLQDKQLELDRSDAILLLYVYLRSHLSETAEGQLSLQDRLEMIDVGRRLCQRLKDEKTPTEEDAKTFCADVLQPVRSLADKMKDNATKDQWQCLEDFYAAAADLVWSHVSLKWSDNMEDSLALVENLLGGAIHWAEQRKQNNAPLAELARYYNRRGQARILRQNPNLKEIIEDAERAIKYDDKLHAAHGLRARAFLKRSRLRASTDDRVAVLADLGESIESGEKATALYRETDPVRVVYFLNLSSAYLKRGHLDLDLKNSEADFNRAAECAKDAAQGPEIQDCPDWVDFAIGNACEDLAYLVGVRDNTDSAAREKRAKYYGDAVKAFQKAANKRFLPADAYCYIGRCYYKAVVESRLNDDDLDDAFNKGNAGQVIEECKKSLRQAISRDSNLAEAHWYFGLVHEYQKKYKEADECFEKAKDGAKRTGGKDLDEYVEKWATLPLKDKRLNRQQQLEQVQSRIQENPGLAPRAALTLAQEKAKEHEKKQEWEQAKAVYEKAITDYEKAIPAEPNKGDASLVPLLLGRAGCNRQLAEKARLRAADKAGIKDLYKNILDDAQRAVEVAGDNTTKSLAHDLAAFVYSLRYVMGPSEADWAAFVVQSEKWIQLAPIEDKVKRYSVSANSIIDMALVSADKPDKTTLALVSKAIEWLELAIHLLKQQGLDFGAQQKALVSQLEVGITFANKTGNQKQADKWKEKLDELTAAQPKK